MATKDRRFLHACTTSEMGYGESVESADAPSLH